MKLEICVDTLEAATIAADAGVARIELCSALSEGGLTPSLGVMKKAGKLPVSCHAMIRPRGHGFAYSEADLDAMKYDILAAKKSGMDGVVLGVLNADNTLNIPALRKLIETALPLEVTLHRAIDMTPDPLAAVEQAIDLGFQRILTSGQCETAFEGADTIAAMVSLANNRIEVMAGSGVNTQNVTDIVARTNIADVHSSCAALKTTSDHFGFEGPEAVKITDRATVDEMLNILEKIAKSRGG